MCWEKEREEKGRRGGKEGREGEGVGEGEGEREECSCFIYH